MASVPNYGLLTNMASGIREGMNAYQTQANINRQNQMQNLVSGVQQGDDGNLQFTPEMQQQRENQRGLVANQLKESNYKTALSDSSSPESKGFIHSMNTQLPKDRQLPEDGSITGEDAKGIVGLAGKGMSQEQMLSMFNMRNQNQRDKTRINSNMAANKEYDHVVGPYEQQIKSASKIAGTIDKILDSNGDLTSNKGLASDLSAGLASMVSGKQATVSGMHAQEFNSLESNMNQLQSFIQGKTPNTITRDQLLQMKKDVQAVDGENREQWNNSYKSLRDGLDDTLVPKMDSRFNSFSKQLGPKSPSNDGASNQSYPADVMKYASEHGVTPAAAASIKAKRTGGQEASQPSQKSGNGFLGGLFGGG